MKEQNAVKQVWEWRDCLEKEMRGKTFAEERKLMNKLGDEYAKKLGLKTYNPELKKVAV